MNTSNYLLGYLVSRINFGTIRKLRFIKVKLNKTILEILKILYKYGVIRTFIVRGDKILIYNKYYLSKSAVKLSLVSKPGNRIYLPLSQLAIKYNDNNFSGFYIISTQKGLCTSDYCLLHGHISGEILIKVEV